MEQKHPPTDRPYRVMECVYAMNPYGEPFTRHYPDSKSYATALEAKARLAELDTGEADQMPQIGRRRDLLHENKLDAFRQYVKERGYTIHPRPLNAVYEVLRIEWPTPSGSNPHMVFYKRDTNIHITVPKEAVFLVLEFLKKVKEPIYGLYPKKG